MVVLKVESNANGYQFSWKMDGGVDVDINDSIDSSDKDCDGSDMIAGRIGVDQGNPITDKVTEINKLFWKSVIVLYLTIYLVSRV